MCKPYMILGINESNYFLYNGWGQCALPPPLTLHVQAIHTSQLNRSKGSHRLLV